MALPLESIPCFKEAVRLARALWFPGMNTDLWCRIIEDIRLHLVIESGIAKERPDYEDRALAWPSPVWIDESEEPGLI